jgi:hypothetical protein
MSHRIEPVHAGGGCCARAEGIAASAHAATIKALAAADR